MPEETERVEFNIESVTVDEAELLEETLGIPWIECIGVKSGMAKVMRGFVWLAKRRDNPDLQLADVHFDIVRFAQELGAPEPEDDRPLSEASEPSATTSKSSSTRSTESVPGSSDNSLSSNSKGVVPVSSP